MNKNFTKEDIIKKHQTNVKSAQGVFALMGMLGIIYIVRYFITNNFDFYFGMSFTEVILRKTDLSSISSILGYSLVGIFMLSVFTVAVVIMKKPKWLNLALGLYLLDFAALVVYLVINIDTFTSDRIIDIVFHIIVTVFLIVGLNSDKKLRINEQAATER